MSDDEQKDEPTDESDQQTEEQSTDSDQSAEQTEDQTATSDEPAEQSEEQPTDSDQAATQSEEQPASSDQASDQAVEQPAAGSDQAAEQSEGATGGGGGGGGGSGGGVGGGGPTDDAVAADSGSGPKHTLQVIAKFTQEGGQMFPGDIKLNVYEYDEQKGKQGRKLFGGDVYDWQLFDLTNKNQNTIYTPMRTDVTGSHVAISVGTRVKRDLGGFQFMYAMEVFAIPSGDTLRVKAEVELENVNETVNAPTADKAKGMVTQLPKFDTKHVVQLIAKPIGKQQFSVTGKVYTGRIFLGQLME